MPKEAVIVVDHVKKDFILPHEKAVTIKSAFTGILRKKDKAKDIQHALRDISFKVNKGEFFGIVGRNGSGKSTLLKMLSGIYQPTGGTISTYGKIVPLIELGVGFSPELSGWENVYLNGAILGFSEREVAAKYDDIVAFAGLENFMDQKVKNYSSGMQVRLAFACATMAEADILIVDEVLAVGDADFQKKCFKYFKGLKNSGKTVVLVTHDMASVREYCDRAILIEQGLIVEEGNIEKVTTAYRELFNPLLHAEAAVSRWGDQRVRIVDVRVAVPKGPTGDISVITKTEVCTAISQEKVLVAYAIKNDVGQKLFGNKIPSEQLRTVKEGGSYSFTFSFPNTLNAGRYFVDISLFSETANAYLDCWVDCTEFTSRLRGVEGYPIVLADRFSEG